jgi:hypothetical protein
MEHGQPAQPTPSAVGEGLSWVRNAVEYSLDQPTSSVSFASRSTGCPKSFESLLAPPRNDFFSLVAGVADTAGIGAMGMQFGQTFDLVASRTVGCQGPGAMACIGDLDIGEWATTARLSERGGVAKR